MIVTMAHDEDLANRIGELIASEGVAFARALSTEEEK
jgi:hypothetical protein